MKRISIVLVAGLVAGALGGIAASEARKNVKRYESGVTAAYTAPTSGPYGGSPGEVAGKVRPDAPKAFTKKRCKKNRKIALKSSASGRVVGKARSRTDGTYSVPGSVAPGTYVVFAKRKRLSKEKVGTTRVCWKGESSPFSVG